MAKGRLLSAPAINVSSNPKEMYSLCLLTMVLSHIHDIYIYLITCNGVVMLTRCQNLMVKPYYTQATSRCLIQSEVTELNSRKTTKRNSELFPSCLTQEVGSVTRSQRASVLSSQTLLTILNVEPLYLRIVAAPEN